MAVLFFSSYEGGPANSAQIRNGVNGTPTSCGSAGCHGTGGGTTATIRVDSVGGVQVTRYVPGMTYTVTVGGINTTGLTNFGMQYSSVSGSGTSQVQAGTFAGIPTGIMNHVVSGIGYVEQMTSQAGAGGVFSKSFQWTAPATGVGNLTMYLTVNAVNNGNNADATDLSGNVNKVLTQASASGASVGTINNGSFSVYPNPVLSDLNIVFTNATAGTYNIAVFDLAGKQVAAQTAVVSGASQVATIDAHEWAAGIYSAIVEKDGARKVISIAKQ